MQPSDIGRLVSLGSPAVSPDGAWIAVTVRRVDLERNRYDTSVLLAAADGGVAPRRLTGSALGDGSPVWSPDGSRLAVVTTREEGGSSLRVLPIGVPGEPVTVCERPEAITEPAWSPDGSRIAFVSRERSARWAAGEDERAREPRRIDRLFTRLDGEGWIVDRPSSVFVVDADGGAPVVVAGGPYEHANPAWSPDGRTLAVVSAREPDWDLQEITHIYLVDAAGGAEPRRLTVSGAMHTHPAWSPDGASLATLASDDHVAVPAHGYPALVDVASGAERALTTGLDRQCRPYPSARAPVFDGDEVIFAVEDHGGVHLYRAGTGGNGSGPARPLLTGDRVVTAFDHAGGTTAVLLGDPDHLPELHVLDPGGAVRRLTGLTDAFHAALGGASPVRLAVPSPAGDGDVDTWVLLPDGGDGPVPVLLSVHGGPATQYASVWFDEFRLWAAAGYAVVWCNPHGSTGHTEDWTRAIRAPQAVTAPGTGWGGIDADDVLAALDGALAAFDRLDRDRVGVLGGSYGGYITSWLAAHHSDRFAAACSERAVNNLESLDWSSDAAGWFHWEFGPSPWTDPQPYRDMSPLTHVAGIDVPMLILHSEEDLRCPVEQADALFVALRLLGKPVEYWRFPAESHGLSRSGSPRHRVHRAQIILDFFGRHLGGTRPDEVPAG
ncbi:S9 family peptidase [Pseudonocardia sp. HH130630-07]|uniref:S9 family peptidase n=1 Tax=Pseudonocardia sp. HH130630-07 TaxID=1690815 RepID=UPI000814BA1B|nr:S9 family peptidase [Pseudonocardia sp. HH130630-07]ANY05853.1 peptidase S9 [Pseudonocardia sp. HH130630-07]